MERTTFSRAERRTYAQEATRRRDGVVARRVKRKKETAARWGRAFSLSSSDSNRPPQVRRIRNNGKSLLLRSLVVTILSIVWLDSSVTASVQSNSRLFEKQINATVALLQQSSYTNVTCSGYFSNLNANEYLNLSSIDVAKCPVRQMFYATNNYFPVWGYESNVANDYGKILVRQSGECTVISDTSASHDFQIPCKAHDYCYDLRKASFSGTVSDKDCDDAFNQLMKANCNDRSFINRQLCNATRATVYRAVRLGPVVTDPNPGVVVISNIASRKCVDVEGPSLATRTPLQQWKCKNINNQRFRIWPSAGASGYFEVRPVYPTNRCVSIANSVWIDPCNSNQYSQQVRIRGIAKKDEYIITSRIRPRGCWHVPHSTKDGLDLLNPYCNVQDSWSRWRINSG